MKKTIHWKFTLILLLVGFMTAVQFNSMKNPEKRDTRDVWAIRQDLATEKQIHSEMLSEIRELDKTILTYRSLNDENTGRALAQTVDKLHRQAGVTDIEGPGIVIKVEPSAESAALGIPITGISPELLTRFVNELNRFKGLIFEIDGKRYTILSSIRDINGMTTVNGLNVSTPPFTMKIVSPTFADSEKLYSYLAASTIHDDFYLDDLILEVGKPKQAVEIRGYSDRIENQFLKELPKGE
ncbi:DUF881 domain-containing protein [Sporosarcina sp. JAI121]|uniref:DUF881 domain-containing protein n=1 Tax=Sporosarcina sp. JAI121 TaxID=2723064 RepID=UPI0015C8560C|nr:DUF881 domain-containing protein [Sporosarcina sp. JAI121]NYF24144.1 uncharacterized protein YlxW (UPF0749 family) [Sporosarcina sp. JAI121]